jgi:hypothetical protein
MKTYEIIRLKGIINTHQRKSSIKDKIPKSLSVGKEIALGSSGRELGHRIENLVGGGGAFL